VVNDKSQVNVAMHLRCNGMFNKDYCKFINKSVGERILIVSLVFCQKSNIDCLLRLTVLPAARMQVHVVYSLTVLQ